MHVITVCGSGKSRQLVHTICRKLEEKGLIVLAPPLHNIDALMKGVPDEGVLLAWKGATFAHLNRLLKCDICLLVNANGYLGVSSTLEFGYAVALGKLIVALNHDEELAREALFDRVLGTEDPNEVATRVLEICRSVGAPSA